MSTPNLSSLIKQLNHVCQTSLEQASSDCLNRTHSSVELEHWLIALLQTDSDLRQLLTAQQIPVHTLQDRLLKELERKPKSQTDTPTLSINVITWIKEAWYLATLEDGQAEVRSYHLLLAMLQAPSIAQLVQLLFPSMASLNSEKIKLTAQESIDFTLIEGSQEQASASTTATSTAALEQFTVNLNQQAEQGKIDPAIGREHEIRQVIDILLRRRQNNPILTGEPGVGKTAVVEGLALKIHQGDVPAALAGIQLHTLDLGLLMAGAGVKGEFEKRLKQLIHEIKHAEHSIILFIDEAHTIIGAGNQSGSLDAANLLKPALARGELKTIAATTWSEYKQYFEQDAALTRRFQIVKIEEPDDDTAIAMCHSVQASMEAHHQVMILDSAIEAAVKLSRRTIAERHLPDKAISLIDTACARVALEQQTQPTRLSELTQLITSKQQQLDSLKQRAAIEPKKQREQALKTELTALKKEQQQLQRDWQQQQRQIEALQQALAEPSTSKAKIRALRAKIDKLSPTLVHFAVDDSVVQHVISDWTGIPIERLNNNNSTQLQDLEHDMQQQIKGQDHAIEQITRQLKLYFAGLVPKNKPIGVFLFSGPSGVGKTHTARCLAERVFGSQSHMTTINLSEFKEAHKVSMLLGAPAGYVGYGEGGVLTEAVRRQPYHLVLLDEVEKAHHSVHEIFYQIFDQGFAQDGQGRRIDFSNTLFVLTSNIGASTVCNNPELDDDALTEAIKQEAIDHFSPAFIGRMETIAFKSLKEAEARAIVQQQLDAIRELINDNQGPAVQFTDDIIDLVLQQSQYQHTGARSFDQVIRQQVLPNVLEALHPTTQSQ